MSKIATMPRGIVRPGVPQMPMALAPEITKNVMQMKTLLDRAKNRLETLETENASLTVRVQHLTGCLICLLQDHECFKMDARFPIAKLNELEEKQGAGLGIDTSRDDMTDQLVIRVMNIQQAQARLDGFLNGAQDMVVPKKPPFRVKLDIPPGGKFYGLATLAYKGGKSDGKLLEYTPNRPKKPRDFTVVEEDNGEVFVVFSTDSSGMTAHAKFTFQLALENAAVVEDAPLVCENDWHKHENDGEKYIGRCCPDCGDSRKILEQATEPV